MTTKLEAMEAITLAVGESGRVFRAPIWQRGSNNLPLEKINEQYMSGLVDRAKQQARNKYGKQWGADGRTGPKGGHDYSEFQIRAIFEEMIAMADSSNGRRNFSQSGLSAAVFKRALAILFSATDVKSG